MTARVETSTLMTGHGPILITGFGPFPGVDVNASGLFAERLADAARVAFPSLIIVAEILPTAWTDAPRRLATLFAELKPEIALHFGVSQRARVFVLENRARNHRDGRPDAAGVVAAAGCIESAAPADLSTTLPIGDIARRLAGISIPFQCSDDAGCYLCNALYFQSLRLAAGHSPPCRSLFVHIPVALTDDSFGGSALDWSSAIRGGLAIIDVCLGASAVPGLRKR